MDHPTRRLPRPSSTWGALALTVAILGAAGIVSGCKGSDEKKPDGESVVALKTPEPGELPAADDAAGDSGSVKPDAKREALAPHLKTSAAEAGAAAGDEPAAGAPATVTARTSKKLPARAAATGPMARTPTTVRRPATTLRPGTPDAAGTAGDDPTAAAATDGDPDDSADEGAAQDEPADGVAGDPGTILPPHAPTRLAGAAPPAGTPAPKPAAPAAPPLDADRFLPLTAVRELVGERRIMAIGPLAGLEAAPGYNSLYYGVPGKETFGTAVQAWQDQDRRGCVERYRRMREQYPNAEDVKLLEPTKAFYSSFGAIQTLTMTDTNKRLIVSVSCGAETCSQQVLLKLAQHAKQQM